MSRVRTTITLSKTFAFEAAHRIAKGYNKKCRNIHGHSWNGEICIVCNQLDNYGMGVDFNVLQKFLNTIVDYFDHKLILYKGDKDLISLCKASDLEVVVFDDENPTSERVAKYIYKKATLYFDKSQLDCRVKSVMISETCTSKCVWAESVEGLC